MAGFTRGSQLGPYEIISSIGAGGMGEVFRARDARLQRDVAIKALPQSFSNDPDRIVRFHREAQAIAALNHPNIAAIYDVCEQAGSRFLVLELVEGETLADKLMNGPLPVAEMLAITSQICDALEAAHEKGIVHRDLKPRNIMLGQDGSVKLLDFGLARFFERDGLETNVSNSPTMLSGSIGGVIIGTAAYMSPEQARGKLVDQRTDIWALGCCMYEMLTGRQAFQGETATDIIAAVIERQPDWNAFPPATSSQLRSIIQDTLQKNLRNRIHSAADVRIQLTKTSVVEAATSGASGVTNRPWMWLATALTILLAATSTVALLSFRTPATQPRAIRFGFDMPDSRGRIDNAGIDISPDGRAIVFPLKRDGVYQLWIRRLDSLAATLVPGTEGAAFPFWSPDSDSLGFIVGNKLKVVSLKSNAQRSVGTLNDSNGALTWTRQGWIVFGSLRGIRKIPAAGGVDSPVELHDELPQQAPRFGPQMLPDDRHFFYRIVTPASSRSRIYVGSLDSNATKLVIEADSRAVYAQPGWIVFNRDNSLWAQRFDTATLQTVGDAVPVAQNLTRAGAYTVSNGGVLCYVQNQRDLLGDQVWVDSDGKEVSKVAKPPSGEFVNPVISHNGKYVAFNHREPGAAEMDIWIVDIDRNIPSRFAFGSGSSSDPVWSPDDKSIAFASSKSGKWQILRKFINGSSEEEVLGNVNAPPIPTDWSPDGRALLLSLGNAPGRALGYLSLDDRQVKLLSGSLGNPYGATFSPDGKWLSYTSSESGQQQVYVDRFPDLKARVQVSNNGGLHGRWSRTRSELIFDSIGVGLQIVRYRDDAGGFQPELPRQLFERLTIGFSDGRHHHAIHPSGQRFLIRQAMGGDREFINVVVNWTADLSQ